MNFGERLRTAREKKDMWQKDAAAMLNITSSQLSRYERNVTSPIPDQIRAMAELYDVTANYLVGLEDRYPSPHGATIAQEQNSSYLSDFNALSPEKKRVIRTLVKLLHTETKE